MAAQNKSASVAGQNGRTAVTADPRVAARRARLLRQAAGAGVWERLEHRTLMSASAWTGAGADGNVSTPGNWQGLVAPAAGDDVSFGGGAASQAVTVDGPTTVGSVTFTAGGYAVGGTNALTVSGGIADAAGDDAVNAPVTLAGTQAVTAAGGSTLTIAGDVDDAGSGFGLTKAGAGTVILSGTDTYGGATNVAAGTLRADGLLLSDVTLAPGTALGGTGIVGSVTATGATVVPGETGTGDGTITTTGGLTLDAGSNLVLSLDGNTPGNGAGNYGQVSVGGDVALNGATLSVALGADYTPAAGDMLTLVNNGGSNPVAGTFAGLPEGHLLTVGGSTFRISYVGGDGNDVTLSFVRPTGVALTSDATPGYRGQTVTFTAAVAPTDGQGGVPTGTVTFYDNGSALGAAQAVDGGGHATLAVPALSVGTHTITAQYGGDVTFQMAASAALSQVISPAATASTVTSSTGGSSVSGQAVTFTAAVATTGAGSGTPGGTVTFKDGATTLATRTLDGSGQATFTTAALSTASHSITVVYAGAGDYAASTSAAVTQAVAKASAGVALTSNAGSTVFGQAVVYTATAAATGPGAGTPGGTVTFKDGATTLGTAALNASGVATYTGTTLGVGSHTVTAVYGGNANFLTATSGGLTQTVAQALTRAVVTSSLGTTVWGQGVTLSAIFASVAPGSGVPTGQATFFDNGVQVGSAVTLASGRATLATSALTVGSHAITVQYAGDANHAAVTSGAFTQHVNKAALSLAVTSSDAAAVWGESVSYTVTATATAPGAGTPDGGAVTLTDENGNTVGTGTLTAGSVTISGSPLAIGSHTITATYAGDGNFNGGTGAAAQAVAKAATTVGLTSSASPSVSGESVTFTAAVSVTAPGAATASGTVTFYDGDASHVLGTGTVSAGQATFTTATLSTGTHNVYAVYGGDAHLTAGTSPTIVQAANQDTTTTAVTTANASTTFGDTATFTATVTGDAPSTGTPTGSVTFLYGGTPIGAAVALVNGTATVSTAALPAGTYAVTAVYGGDTDFSNSTSGAVTQTVAQATTTTAVTASANPSTFGQSVTYTATVAVATGAGVPTGTVQFSVDAGATVVTVPVAADGTATYTTAALALAGHTVDVTYSGDANFAGSSAATLNQTVNAAGTTTAVTSDAASAAFGHGLTLTATVAAVAPASGVPTGATVTFYVDGNAVGTGTVDGAGHATLAGVTPAVGSHAVTAAVAATGNYAASTSAAYTQAVTQATTSVTVGATTDTVFGQSATLTATVAVTAGAGTPTGTVSFYDGATLIGTAGVVGGTTATMTDAALAVGDHAITAVYSGDADFAPATAAAAATQHVGQAATTVSFASSDAANAVWGEAVTYTVSVAAAAPGVGTPTGGTVTIYDAYADVLGTGTLVNGTVTITGGQLPVGTSTMQAVYAGDADFTGNGSPTASQVVAADGTTTTVTSSAGTAGFGQAVTFTAAVAANAPGAGTPAGTVTFYADGNAIGTVQTLASGTAAVTVSSLAVGSPTITATFAPADGHFTGGTSAGLSQTVSATATTVTLSSNHPAAVTGQSVTVTATVAPAVGSAVPTGTVQFYDGGVAVGSPVAVAADGTATMTGPGVVGTHTITADYANADGNFSNASAAAFSQVVNPAGVTVTASAPASSVHGQSVTLSATVAAAAPGAGTPTGTVEFFANGVSLGTAALSAGTASLSTTALVTGADDDVTVTYAGDANFQAGATADHAADVAVAKASTTLTMSPTANSTFGAPATLTATVAAVAPGAGTPTGSVTFYADGDAAHPLGTVAVNGFGTATITSATLTAGDHTITASYTGDADFTLSTTAAGVTQHVVASNTLTSLAQSAGSSQYNTAVALTATVTANGGGGGTPSGIVDFFDGPTLLGTGTLSAGQATYTAWGLSVGTHSLRAVYTGDQANNYVPSQSAISTQTVALGSTATALTSSVNPSVVGQQVTYTAAVTSVAGAYGTGVLAVGGTVTFADNGVAIGTGTVDGTGHATFATSALAVAGHPITATYGGDARYATSASAAVTQTVQQGTVTVAVSSSAATTAVFGQAVTLTAAVNAVLPATGNPTGTVTFYDGATPIGTATISAGQAQVTTAALSVGTHSVVAVYGGDASFVAGTSGTFAQAVLQDAAAVSVVSDHNPAVAGQTVQFTATVAAAAPGAGLPTGTVTFLADGTPIAGGTNVALVGGVASVSTAALGTAGHLITVQYGGDGNFTPATSNALTQSQQQDATGVGISLTLATAAYGQPVGLTATVTANAPGSGVPTGTVTFYDVASGTPVSLGQATMAGGVATLPALTPHAGSYSVEAVYSGDVDFTTATSATTPLAVSAAATTTTLGGDTAAVFGQPLSLTATVAATAPGGGVPTGTVAFYDGATLLGSAPLAAGVATLAMPMAVGTHAVTAVYAPGSGDDAASSTASAATVTVSPAATTTALSAPADTVIGQTTSFTATVTAVAPGAGVPTGSVTFFDGTTPIQTVNLDAAGTATLTTAALVTGPHTLTAQYSGDANFTPGGLSAPVAHVVSPGTMTGAVTAAAATSTVDDDLTFTATFAAVAPAAGIATGTVTFYNNGVAIGTAALDSNDVATVTLAAPAAGTYAITAAYGGDANFLPVTTTPALAHTVTQLVPTVTLSPTAATVFGQAVTLTAAVNAVTTGAAPTGTVTFYADGVQVGTAQTLASGQAQVTTAALAVGSHAVTAVYSGDARFAAGPTATATQAVGQDGTTVALSSDTNPAVAGQTVVFHAAVAAAAPGAGVPTGTVTFYADGTALGTPAAVDGTGVATLTTTVLSTTGHTITAVYAGDVDFTTSTSNALSQAQNRDATTVSLNLHGGTGVYGQPRSVTATVAAAAPGSGVPTGTVTFYDNSGASPVSLGQVTMAGGVATVGGLTLSVGAHTITAVYSGDADFAPPATLVPTGTLTVTAANASVALTGDAAGVFGQVLHATATVTAVAPGAGVPAGSVAFYDGDPAAGGTLIATVALNPNGVATVPETLAVGSHTVVARFVPTGSNFLAATGTLTHATVVAKAATTVALTAGPATVDGTATLTATTAVTGPGAGTVTGSVGFYDGANLLGSAPVDANGVATFTATGLAGGDHAVTAVYSGDGHFLTATSAPANDHVPLPGTVQFSQSAETISEAGQVAVLTVARTGGTEGAVSVNYTVTAGTAALGINHALANGTLQFAAGQATATISVPVLDDGHFDMDRTMVLTLSAPTGGATVGATATNTLTIANADAAPAVSVGNVTLTAAGYNQLATFTVSLSAPSDLPTVVHVHTVDGSATAGTDYVGLDGVVVIPALQTTATVGVTVLGTAAYNPTRTFSVAAYAADGATPAAAGTATILNVNYPAPTVANVSATVAPGAAATLAPLATARSFDGNPLTLTVATQPAAGTAAVVAGKLVYTPAAGSVAGDTFTYTVTDDKGGTATATATVAVQGVGLVASPVTPGARDLVVVGTAGNDTIAFKAAPGPKGSVKVTVNGVASATYQVTGRLVALGMAGNDVITATGTTPSAWFYGGTGNDTLTGAATNDVLVGGDGNDAMNGGGGRNLLLGGNGADSLKSAGAGDLLVADATAYDAPTPANQVALAVVQAGWVSRKVNALRLSAAPGDPTISAATVASDGSADVLVGKRTDWYVGDFTFAGGNTTFTDGRHLKAGQSMTPTKGELVTQL